MTAGGHEISLLQVLQLAIEQKNVNQKKRLESSALTGHFADAGKKLHPEAPLAPVATASALGRIPPEERTSADPSFLRWKQPVPDKTVEILVMLDVSRSAGFEKRLSFAKSAVMTLLSEAYQQRSKVGLLTFGNQTAHLQLPFTKSVEEAAAVLEQLQAQGNTPLGPGLRCALTEIEKRNNKKSEAGPRTVLLLITDGKANFDDMAGNPWQNALQAAHQIAQCEITSIVADTDSSVFSMGLAKKLAEAMNAFYVSLVD